jgi:AcrR family transcriptional regulator
MMSARRAEIVQIAKGLFAQQGYAGTSMRDIADASGLLPGSLYTHFRSKAALIEEIVGGFLAALILAQEAVDGPEGPGVERFRRMLLATYEVCQAHPDELTILHQDWGLLSTMKELPGVHPTGVRALRGWTSVIESGIADGTLKPSLNPELVARVTTGAIYALVDPVHYRDLPGSSDPRAAEQLVDLLLGGMVTDRRRVGRRAPTRQRAT